MAMVAIESHDLPCIGRLSGADVRSWLSEHGAVHGWWLCFDADDALIKVRPQHWLAYCMSSNATATSDAMSSSELVGRGVSASTRRRLLGTSMVTSRVYLRNREFNFLWVGTAEPGWTVRDQLDGQAQRAPPSVIPWNRAATRQAGCATPHAAGASSAAGSAVTPAAAAGSSAAASTSGEDASARLSCERARHSMWLCSGRSFAACSVMSGLGSAPATQGAPLRPKQRPSCRLARLAARARERMRMVLSRVRAVRGPTHACLRVLYTSSADHTIDRMYRYGSYVHAGALWLCL